MDAIDQKHIVPAHLAVLFHPAGLIQQIEHPPDAAADVAHALALAGVIGGEGGVERTVDVAHRLSRHAVVLRVQVHLDHGLCLFLPKQTFQRRVFVHCLLVGAAQESVIHRAEQLVPEWQLVPAAVLQLMPAHHHFHLCRQADALGLAHHLPVAECAGQTLVDAGGRPAGQTVRQKREQHTVVLQQPTGVEPVAAAHLPAHPPQIPQICVIIADGKLRKIGSHAPFHCRPPFPAASRCMFLQ